MLHAGLTMNRSDPVSTESRGAERIAGLILAVLLVAGGVALAVRFGPAPPPPDRGDSKAALGPAPAAGEPARANAGDTTPFDQLGFANLKTSGGQSDLAPAQVLDGIAATYLARGFVRGDGPAGQPSSPGSAGRMAGSDSVYFRSECPIATIVGIGRNADPASEAAGSELAAFFTVAVPSANGGSVWATYRYDKVSADALAKVRLVDENGDFPGVDPPDVPRMPGARRILAMPRLSGSGTIGMYVVTSSLAEVRDYYAREMEKRYWRLDPYQMMGVPGTGALIYTLGDRSCTIWIQQYRFEAERVGIIVASR